MTNRSGGSRFNKLLNFIGIVDDKPTAEGQGREKEPAGKADPKQRPSDRDYAQREARPEQQGGHAYRREPERDRHERGSGNYERGAARPQPSDDDDFWQPNPTHSQARGAGAARSQSSASGRYGYNASASSGHQDRGQAYDRSAGSSPPPRPAVPPPRSTPPPESMAQRQLDGAYSNRHQAVIYHLLNFEQCREVILSLLDRKSALVNLDQLGDVDVQRAVDTLGGAAFALGATISRASDRTYLITPSNVIVAGGGIERASGPRRYF